MIWLAALLSAVLQKFRSDADGTRADAGLDQEDRKAEADCNHRADEQPRDRGSDVKLAQVGAEQKHDDRADQHRGEDR